MIRRDRGIEYTNKEREDEILDKIIKYGLESVSPLEKLFLDNINNREHYNNLIKEFESVNVFECDLFTIEIIKVTINGNNIILLCNLYTPDLIISNNTRPGLLKGTLRYNVISKRLHNNLKSEKYNIYQFIHGIEYQFDVFLDFVLDNILEDLKFR